MSGYAHVMTAVPSGSSVHADFMASVLAVHGYFGKVSLDGVDRQRLGYMNARGSDLIHQRTHLVWGGFDVGATHLFLADSDMIFPRDTIHRLYAHKKMVAMGNYAGKTKNARVMAQNADHPAVDQSDAVVSFGKAGIEPVKRNGLGCALISMEVFTRIEFPWFGYKWEWVGDGEPVTRVKDPKTFPRDRWVSSYEDWWLFRRCEEAGIPVYVDHDLSNELGHAGGAVYRHGGWDMCEAGR